MLKEEWKDCCRKEICRIWKEHPPMELVHLITHCPDCGHFIGLTQTPEEEARKFCNRI